MVLAVLEGTTKRLGHVLRSYARTATRSGGVGSRGLCTAPKPTKPTKPTGREVGAGDLEADHVWEPRSLRLIKFVTWASSIGLGVYLVTAHEWTAPDGTKSSRRNIFTDIKPALRRVITGLHGGGGGEEQTEEGSLPRSK
ncbi:hypothetical protein HOP50_08g50800 [Chloropicon primus]|uniref:Uncharacterized protein n=1 Tax=Chloropicon primus TaxID=1764295 RepID=A0A5B8MQ59_9CHLO|nr:hypothetical protein A3770_08p50550 [Chloropicon primus]UPR01758.1 hypothetical protein HOP50_08g50800 [Chloropicon primus]|eukprot:QDZ22537.1 hypothetical protein A3770_08p50550 [Chloropicon primus]